MQREVSTQSSAVEEGVECWDEDEPCLKNNCQLTDQAVRVKFLAFLRCMCFHKAMISARQEISADMAILEPSLRRTFRVDESINAQITPVHSAISLC